MNTSSLRPDGADTASSDQSPTEQEAASPAGFEQFGLDPRILRAVADLGFTTPTPIQQKAIEHLVQGADVVGRARTGTGKTAAFGLPLVQRLATPDGARPVYNGVRALVMAPTRELALQVSEAIQTFAKHLNLRVATLYGGASYQPQLRALRDGAAIVVGTPGRLIDHLDRGTLDLGGVEMVVLDEADEMLRMGFIDDVEKLVGATPNSRQVALFSATMPPQIRRVADRYLKSPVLVQDDSGPMSVAAINQQWIYAPQRFKGEALLRLLHGEPRGTTLIFSRTRAGCAEAADALGRAGFQTEALHGDMSQSARERVLELFRAKRLDVVVATDVAARGIDIEHITHVINFDLPENGETYTHRIGRTGRAGRTGTAITIITPSQIYSWRSMMRHIRAEVEEIQLPTDYSIAMRQLESLTNDFARVAPMPRAGVAWKWVQKMMDSRGWTEGQVAAYAVAVLAGERGANLEDDPSDEPETWGQPNMKKKRAPVERQAPASSEPAAPRAPRAPRAEFVKVSPPVQSSPPPRQAPAPRVSKKAEADYPVDDVSVQREVPVKKKKTIRDDVELAPRMPCGDKVAPAKAAAPVATAKPVRAAAAAPAKPTPAHTQDDERAPVKPTKAPKAPRAAAPSAEEPPARPRRKTSDEVEVTLPVGKQQGVEPSDVFGAFANEAGLSRDDIGRISIHERVSVIRLAGPIAATICERFPALHVQGKKVPLIGPPPSVLAKKTGMEPPRRAGVKKASRGAPTAATIARGRDRTPDEKPRGAKASDK